MLLVGMSDKRNWAASFKEKPNCNTCPFILTEVDNGVGIQRHCDHVCKLGIEDILKEMEVACI